MKAYALMRAGRKFDLSGSKAHNDEYSILVMKGQLMTSSIPCLQKRIGEKNSRHTEPLVLSEESCHISHQNPGSIHCCVLQWFGIQSAGPKPWHRCLLLVVLAVADLMGMNGCHTGVHSQIDLD